ncbi:Zn-ribbon-containing protein [soil metagenome]
MTQNVVEITFSIEGDRPKIVEEIEGMIAALLHQGQIIGQEIIIADEPEKLVYVCYAPTNTSLEPEHFSDWGRASLVKLSDDGCTMTWKLLSNSTDKIEWESAEYLVLFARTIYPPISNELGETISTYSLPLHESHRSELRLWNGLHNACDELWLGSEGELELSAYKQMAEPKSFLSEFGRTLCSEVQKATKKPTYYYLQKFYGRQADYKEIPCPGCGGNWKLAKDDIKDLWDFPFRCESCRLISSYAVRFDNEKRSKIGEYSKS